MECPYCGHQNADDATNCQACGQPLRATFTDISQEPIETPPSDQPPEISYPNSTASMPPQPQMAPPTPAAAKKSFPWGWAAFGCVVVFLAVVVVGVGIALAIKFGPAIQNQVLRNVPNITTNNNNPSAPSAPSSPSSPGNPGGRNGALPFKFDSVNSADTLGYPTLFSSITDALGLNNDTDFQAPKNYTGTITLDPSAPFGLGNGWCAKDDATLKNNMANIQYMLSINGTSVDLSKYPTLNFTDDRGDACAITGINITPTGNLSGSYRFKITQHFAKQLEDGISAEPYPAGDVILDFTVRFQGQAAPGLSG